MPAHKFAIGPLSPEMGQFANRGETFVIFYQLLESSGVFQYQIKSEMDGHARVVRESQLADL